MYLTFLGLRNFRNYRDLELGLPPGLVLLCGANGQGKSNLLEAVAFLALTKSPRAENDREVIHFQAQDELPYPHARILGVARHRSGEAATLQIDLALRGPRDSASSTELGASLLQKIIRVDDLPRRSADAVGAMNVVFFSAEDVGLVTGPPAVRRRFMDILASQLDRGYLRALQAYQRVLAQRNHLLRRIQGGLAKPLELAFWDTELRVHGTRITQTRSELLEALAPLALRAYGRLAPNAEALEVRYQPSVAAAGKLAQSFQELLDEARQREVALGQTLVGPHRDDVRLLMDGRDAGVYASRGQACSVALALRMAEADLFVQRAGEEPILLLDDALGELDASRRRRLLERALQAHQCLMTLTDPEHSPEAVRQARAILRVHQGKVTPLDPVGGEPKNRS